MTTNGIEILLEKYFEGNTSIREEKILRDFFQGNEIPVHLQDYKPLFTFLVQEQKIEMDEPNFEQKLDANLPGYKGEAPIVRLYSNRNRFAFITSIAAGFLLLLGLFFTFRNDVFKEKYSQTKLTDTNLAYANASEALLLVSGNLNFGLKQVERLGTVDKAMKNMQRFNKFYQVETLIINPDEIINQSIKSK
jgi:hypothetical protein